ncbi:MAG: hypothetical protein LN413_03650 [Candidatus Thermoplasmatota archaeon]|nr:hypothetical protein [Candidatus Thermoplasmatota archaeon]
MQRRALDASFGKRLSLTVLGLMAVGIAVTLLVMQVIQPIPGARAQEDEVDIWVLGVEFKGTAGAGEPYISEGDKVERYVFVPDRIIVQQGQHVHLHFLGINGGGGHTVTIENYLATPFTYFRNQTVVKEFTADEAGVFKIVCSDHPPTMVADLIVEPSSSASAIAGVDLFSAVLLGAQAVLFVVTLVIVLLRRPRA